MLLRIYLAKYYHKRKQDFAAEQGIKKQTLTNWLNNDYIVINGVVYSPKAPLVVNMEEDGE